MDKHELIFVYNEGSDLFSTVADFAHKIFSPSTYQCSLCSLTYGNFFMKQEWKTYIEDLPAKTTFLHKDEFEKQYKLEVSFPAIFISTNKEIKTLVSKAEIDNCKSLQQLTEKLSSKLLEYDQHHHSNI